MQSKQAVVSVKLCSVMEVWGLEEAQMNMEKQR